jgi:hypothetical protein
MSTPALPRYEHCVDGASAPRASAPYLATDEPYNGQTWGESARGAAGKPFVIEVPMLNNPVPSAGHWNIKDIYSSGKKVSHASTD